MSFRAICLRFQHKHCLALLFFALSLSATTMLDAAPLDFTLNDLDQQPVHLSDFRGRWVVINFWATWCTPCVLEMPELQAFHETNRERATVIGVNFGEPISDGIRAFVKQLAITFPIVLSDGNEISGFEVKGLPTTFLVSPNGELIDTHLGAVSADMLNKRLAELEKVAE